MSQVKQDSTLVRLHVHAGSGAVVGHWLALAHVHLALAGNALGGGYCVIVGSHRAVTAGGHVHGTTGHVGRLVWTRTLYGHVVGS